MKFELQPYHRNISPEEIRNDIRRVASQLGRTAITIKEYSEHGRYSPDVAMRRFGSWLKALEAAGLDKTRNMRVSPEECLVDLKDVAQRLHKKAISRFEYRDNGKYSPSTLIRHFGSWFKALEMACLDRTRTLGVTNEEYFKNLEEMWMRLGRQPYYSEVCKPLSKYSASAYAQRFGSWRKALESFVAFCNDGKPAISQTGGPANEQAGATQPSLSEAMMLSQDRVPRTISWRLRFLVMRRDNFKCRICGRSPATHPGLILHVDHVVAWSKGGRTVMENLQTLCEQDNIGKSDLSMNVE